MKQFRAIASCCAVVVLAAAVLMLAGCASGAEKAPVRFIEYTDPESPYCIEVAPVVERLRAEYAPVLDAFDVVDVTTASGTKQAEEDGVFVTPTFVLTDDDGAELDRIIGQATEADLRAMIDDAVAAAE